SSAMRRKSRDIQIPSKQVDLRGDPPPLRQGPLPLVRPKFWNCYSRPAISRSLRRSAVTILTRSSQRMGMGEAETSHRLTSDHPGLIFEGSGGPSRNRTGVQGFAVLCVTTPPSGLAGQAFGGWP